MTKRKNTLLSHKDCVRITPLSVETCVNIIQQMAHYELEIEIKHQSQYSAELQLVERYNDDVPLYITYRLMGLTEGTCVSYHLSSLTLRNPQRRIRSRKKFDPTAQALALIVAIGFIIIFALDLSTEVFMFHLFIISPLLLIPASLMTVDANSGYGQTEVAPKQQGKINQRMMQRAEVVKQEVLSTLNNTLNEEQHDELGNAYYLDVSDKQKGTRL